MRPTGGVRITAARESCTLDVADRGRASLKQIATAMGVSVQYAHRVLKSAMARLHNSRPDVY